MYGVNICYDKCYLFQAHKIFSVQGLYPVIREALRARGWVEQYMPRPIKYRHKHHNNVTRMSSIDACGSDSDG